MVGTLVPPTEFTANVESKFQVLLWIERTGRLEQNRAEGFRPGAGVLGFRCGLSRPPDFKCFSH